MIVEDQSFEIALNEGVAARRRIRFRCARDEDGVSPYPGLTFSGAELKVGKNFTEVSFSGNATEIADGFYRYECSAGEVDTLGSLHLRTNKTGVRPSIVFTQITGGTPAVPTNFRMVNNMPLNISQDFTLPSGYVVTINENGLTSVKYSGGEILGGGSFHLVRGSYWDETVHPQGYEPTITSKSSLSAGTNKITVIHQYQGAVSGKATFYYTVDGNNINIKIIFENGSAVTEKVGATIPAFFFVGDDLNQIVTNIKPGLPYPSSINKLAGGFITATSQSGAPINFSVWPLIDPMEEFLPRIIGVQAGYSYLGVFSGRLNPGWVGVYELVIHFDSSSDWKDLLAGYKTDLLSRAPALLYTPDVRPICQFVSINPSYVRVDNPYGYNDNGGNPNSQWRRFDKPGAPQAFIDVVQPGLQAVNGQGVIFWQPQGVNPRGIMYRPDFHVFPPEFAANGVGLFSGLRALGFSAGILMRPGGNITSETWTTDTLSAASTAPGGLDEIRYKIDQVSALGVNAYYVDSFIGNPNGHIILKAIREKLGSAPQLWLEISTAASIPYAGLYSEFSYANGTFTMKRNVYLDWIYPGVPCIGQYTSALPPGGYPALFTFMMQNKLIPMIEDYSISDPTIMNALAPLVAQYVDSNNQWR